MTVFTLSFFERQAHRLSNDHLALTVVPAFSGRVMELIVGGRNHFWINEPLLAGRAEGDSTFGGWKNWGGYKTWLAPQSRWPDPGAQSEEMDNVEWSVLSTTDHAIHLLGPLIPWGGVRLGRELVLNGSTVIVRESLNNASETTRTWAVWAVAQFPAPGWATYPATGVRQTLVPPEQPFDGNRLRFKGDDKWKVGALTPEGWGEYRADKWPGPFRVTFATDPSASHPDACNLETWSNTGPSYMELEWLGPLVTLRPGESWSLETKWELD